MSTLDRTQAAALINRHLNSNVSPAAAFSHRPPSPPHVNVGPYCPKSLTLVIRERKAFAEDGITEDEFARIFQVPYTAIDAHPKWEYSRRRHAQMITPAIYLGPAIAAKDRAFLRKEGITMLLAVRDTMSAMARMLSGEKVAVELGIKAAAIDVAGNPELIQAFPRAVRVINDHLVEVYRQQVHELGEKVLESGKKGRVLIFCESGNDRSVCVVAAYLMTVYGMNVIQAVQYIQSQRFCIALDDSYKNLLVSFQEILQAKIDLGKELSIKSPEPSHVAVQPSEQSQSRNNKRGFEDTMDVDMDGSDGSVDRDDTMDRDRFEGRSVFAPYLDY